MSTVNETMIGQHNVWRAGAGLPLFTTSQALTRAAQTHAQRMASGLGLSHDNWVAEIRAEGYTWNPLGQNIAQGCSRLTCTDLWIKSPPHRENILNGAFVKIGIGFVGDWWAVNFGGLQ